MVVFVIPTTLVKKKENQDRMHSMMADQVEDWFFLLLVMLVTLAYQLHHFELILVQNLKYPLHTRIDTTLREDARKVPPQRILLPLV